MKDGIINVYKPSGMTSNDVIYKMRAILGIKKIGHTGTLDPMATGVLPVCINRATRIAEYLDLDFKTYKATMRLGVITSTLDMTGEIEEIRDTSALSVAGITEALKLSSGLIEQIPPLISAIRINGRRLYEFVYSGEEIPPEVAEKIKPRKVFIKSIDIDCIDMGEQALCRSGDFSTKPLVSFTVTCSKGTYIRSIARDAGETLGCGAALESLERTASGAFSRENAVPLSELINIAIGEGLIERMDGGTERKIENGSGEACDESNIMNTEAKRPKMPPEYMIKRLKRFDDEIPEVFRGFVFSTDYPLTHFGKAVVSPELARKFIDGWHLGYNEIDIVERPEFSELMKSAGEISGSGEYENAGSSAGIRIRPEYAGMYKIYSSSGDFIGIAKHSDKYKKLVCEKIFYRI